jgi:hypothetical protein
MSARGCALFCALGLCAMAGLLPLPLRIVARVNAPE